jgi:hypothetical protein
MAVVLGLGAAAMGYYNWRVTGRPLSMPYQVHERTYAATPTPFWAAYNPAPEYRHDVMRRQHVDESKAIVDSVRTVKGYFRFFSHQLYRLLGFYVSPFIMPLLMLPVVLRRSGPMRFAALTCLLVFATVLTSTGVWPHYVAPAVALYLLLVVEGFRNLRVLRLFGLRVGRAAAIVALTFVVLSTALVTVYGVAKWNGSWSLENKARLEAQLESAGGKHLVIVRYWPGEFGLRLMSWGDGTGVPTSAKNLVIVGIDNNDRLHVRIFDQDGHRVTDIDETKLTAAQARAILPLKQRLPGLLPPHEMTYVEEAEVLSDATLIGGQSGPTHPNYSEWVYNRADIDGAKVVWAREMGPARDAELLSYFRDRQAWLVEADATPPKLVPYRAARVLRP